MPSAPKQYQTAAQQRRKKGEKSPQVELRCKEYRKKPWRDQRKRILARDGMQCQNPLCGKTITDKGKAHVDHIEAISLPEEVVCDDDELQTLCASCHSRKTMRESHGMKDGSQARGKRFVVTGPPNSGKTTYVNQHRGERAVVWDADDIVKTMCGAERHKWPEYMNMVVFEMLNGLVRAMTTTDCPELWIIVTDEKRAEQVATRLKAKLVRMGA